MLHDAHRLPNRFRVGVGSEVLCAVALELADEGEPREGVLPVDPHAEVVLVVAKPDVPLRSVLLDERVLEEEGLLLALRADHVHVPDFGHQVLHAGAVLGPGLREVRSHARPEVHRLAHVEDPLRLAEEHVHPRVARQVRELPFDFRGPLHPRTRSSAFSSS